MNRATDYPVHRIEPRTSWPGLGLKELFHYRRLLAIFAWRDVKARYKQTVIGIAWVILQPLLTMAVFSVFFGRWLGVRSGDVPYPIFTFCALGPWTYFVHSLTVASTSVVRHADLIRKTYFPRLLLPMASVLGGLVDLMTALIVLIPLLALHGIAPGLAILALPFFILLAALSALAFGVWLAAVNVRFRDVNQALPFITQLGLFLTPVAYPITIIPEAWRPLCWLNPMTGVIEGFRWALADGPAPPLTMLGLSVGFMSLLLVAGCYWFRREEQVFTDIV